MLLTNGFRSCLPPVPLRMFRRFGSESWLPTRTQIESVLRLIDPRISVDFLRLLKEFFGAMFHIEADSQSGTVLLTGMGVGYKNIARRMQ